MEKKVCYVSLREESWLSTVIGKEQPCTYQHRRELPGVNEEVEENHCTDGGLEVAREIARMHQRPKSDYDNTGKNERTRHSPGAGSNRRRSHPASWPLPNTTSPRA